jgi:hypothetical protein
MTMRLMALQILLLLLLPYSLPLLIPSWRWLLAYAAAVAALVAILFTIWYHAVMASPTRTGLEGIAMVLPMSAALSTAVGTMVRTITLMVRTRVVVVAIHILGAILLPTCVLFWANR